MKRILQALTFSLIAVPLLAAATIAKAEEITIFAAASLTNALQEAADAYRKAKGDTIKLSFASSSVLAKQIEAGAPAQIFISADEKWMDYLAEKKLIEDGTRTSPLGNSLVLIAPADSKLPNTTPSATTDFAALLGADGRLATGDPAHVPAGLYAKEAFEKLGLWKTIEPRLARADNVRAALALVETGEAPLGVVYATDAAASKKVKVLGTFPKETHSPITYPFAVVKGQNSDAVRNVFGFITGQEGAKIFVKYGFTITAGS